MLQIIYVLRLLFQGIANVALILLIAGGIMCMVKLLHSNGTTTQAPSYCKNNVGQSMKIKKIISVDNAIAELQMEDDSIKNYQIKEYIRSPKGTSIRHISIKVDDIICVKN